MKLENIIETAAGNFMAQNSLYWGDRGSISIRSLRDVLHVDLKMRWEFNDSTDPAIDMSYDLKLDCQNNRITVSVKYPSVHTGRFIGIGKGVIGSDDSPLMYETAAHLQDIIRRHTAGCGAFFHEFHGPELYLGAPGR
jgi:hypothetical protein